MPKRNHEEDKNLVFCIERTIYFFDAVTASSACTAIRFIDILELESNAPIHFKISSGGGCCYDGLALYDRLRNTPCKILMEGTGFVGSMAIPIFLAGDRRHVTESTKFMNHQGNTELEGRVEDIKIHFAEMVDLENSINEIIADRTGLETCDLAESIIKGDNFFTAKVAVDLGFAHKIVKNRTKKKAK